MLPGFPSSVHSGDNDSALIVRNPLDLGDGISIQYTVRAPANYGNVYWLWLADGRVGEIFYVAEGQQRTIRVRVDPGRPNPHTILFVPMGLWSYLPPGFDPRVALNLWESDKGGFVALEWDARSGMLDFDAYDDDNQFSSWVLTGLERFNNCMPVNGVPTQARLDIEWSDAAGVRTLILSLNGYQVARGSRTGDGLLLLAQVNQSGVGGQTVIAYSTDLALADRAYLIASWPQSYEMQVDGAQAATVRDNGFGSVFKGRAGPKAAGTYALRVRAISDKGETGAFSAAQNVTVGARPLPPGPVLLQSPAGDWTNTKIKFGASATPGVSYRVYDVTELDGAVNLLTPITPAAGPTVSGSDLLVTMPSLAGAAAGKRMILVAAVLAGVEDGYGRSIVVEYDAAGAIIPGRPNMPRARVEGVDGRELSVRVSYDARLETAAGLQARLYLVAEGAAVNYASPNAVATLGAADGKGFKSALLQATAGANGLYKWIVRISDAAHPTLGNLSANTELQAERWLSNATPGAAATVAAYVEA